MGLLSWEVFTHERAYESDDTAVNAEYLPKLPPIECGRLPHTAGLLGLCLKVNELLPTEGHDLEAEETEDKVGEAQSEVQASEIN